MNLAGTDRQRARAVEHADGAGKVVVGPQVAVELRAVALLDDEDALLAGKRSGELLGGWGTRPRRQQARLDAVAGGAPDRLARRPGKRAPGDHGEVAVASIVAQWSP